MNYRDVVLKLLKKRGQIIVREDAILGDFSSAPDPAVAFEKWLTNNYIEIERMSGSPNIRLYKRARGSQP
jgi:hypothetical protein